ncbi:hypothetical protein [Vibrio phage JSF7]|uniref:Uncharacterized protein n=1 Tax=Vibrio phage JSF7 TaxID=1292086 RepID=A0A219XCZ1_9CAUD|nr:hypothetical protein HOQ92_gp12 [Vibrio phage JSF7]APD18136.1 hypothetical protein [Vibrio phage JSF7]
MLKARGIDKREVVVRLHTNTWLHTVQPDAAASLLTRTVRDQVHQVARLAGVSIYWDRYDGIVGTRGLEVNMRRKVYTGPPHAGRSKANTVKHYYMIRRVYWEVLSAAVINGRCTKKLEDISNGNASSK